MRFVGADNSTLLPLCAAVIAFDNFQDEYDNLRCPRQESNLRHTV